MKACASKERDLVLYLYDELPAGSRHEIDRHLADCPRCTAVLASFRATLADVDRALPRGEAAPGLSAAPDAPHEWMALRRRLIDSGRPPASRPVPGWMLKAAAVILVAGGSFMIGRQWEELPLLPGPGGSLSSRGPAGDDAQGPRIGAPADVAERLRTFSEQTNGYLNRSRLVLLEFANAAAEADAHALKDASRTLLRETRSARVVAGRLADPRIEDLLGQVEGLLREISRLSDSGDATTVERIRSEVNNSGILVRLDLMTGTHDQPGERSRT